MTNASPPPEVRIELASKPAYLCAIRDMARQLTRRMGFSDDQSHQIVLAIDEALANVMKHGYAGRADGRIWLELHEFTDASRGRGLRIIVEDEGVQVDPAAIKGRDLADIRPGGLGVHIIREVMDKAVYERRGDRGMRLTMEKHLSSPAVSTSRGAASSPDQRAKDSCTRG